MCIYKIHIYTSFSLYMYIYFYIHILYVQIYITSRKLYGSGSGVCVYFVYVDIVLWFVALHLGVFWLPFPPLEQLCAPFGFLGQPFDHFGATWAAMEVVLVCLGRYSRCLTASDAQLRAKGFQVSSLRRKSCLLESIRKWTAKPAIRQSGARAAAPNPTSLAPGARMRWV